MDQIIEVLRQINELSGAALDALLSAAGGEGGAPPATEGAPGPGGGPEGVPA